MTGAPILLLRLAGELAKRQNFEISFLLIEGGALAKEFVQTAPVYFWNVQPSRFFLLRVLERGFLKMRLGRYTRQGYNRKKIFSLLKKVDFIMANTIVSAKVVKQFPGVHNNIMFYIHELGIVTETLSDKQTMKFINDVSYKILAPCVYLKDFLIRKYSFDQSKINLLKYFIPKQKNEATEVSDLAANNSNFYVGTCGSLTVRKGFDIFVSIAKIIIRERSEANIHFFWFGADTDSIEYKVFINDLQKCEVAEYVTVTATSTDIQQQIKQLKVFLLTSREDAYPLVVLEAALHGIPSICFKDSGGIPEFIGNDAGITVDYLDVQAFSDAILSLKKNEQIRCKMGEAARAKVAYYSEADNIVREFMACLV
jgi:glycosyltransferase involved in cell wall biosynthesis